ncbi:MAG: hypothetical protein JWN62_3106 [Acidimicrobiales bacterium]|nr:hypothetical protein [Acidimicrobiales bacterium]
MEPTCLERTQRRLESELAEICGHLNVLHARMVELVAESLASASWEGAGIQSPQQWLAWQAGLSPQRAHQIVEVARRCHELPETMAAFVGGELSIDSVAVVAGRAPAHNDHEACDLAKGSTVVQLRKALAKACFPPTSPPDPDDTSPRSKPTPEQQYHLSFGYDDDGNFNLHGRTNAVDRAVIERALREARDALFNGGDPDVTWIGALVEMAERSLGSVRSPSRRELFSVIFHVDAEGAWIHNGPRIPDELAAYVLCDGTVRPLWFEDGLPVNMGRKRRIVPHRTRIVVEDRDRICRHPGCSSSAGLEVHHVRHWRAPDCGETDTANLCCLCRRHHRAHHRGEFSIVGNADDPNGLVFRDANGSPIVGCGRPAPPTSPPPEPSTPYRHASGERGDYRWIHFRPPPDPAGDSGSDGEDDGSSPSSAPAA